MTSKRTTGGTEGKSSAQLQRPKTRSVAEGLLSRTRIPAKPLECSVVWDTDNLQNDKTRGAQTPEMPQTAASQVTGAKRTDGASASCTQHASILRLLGVHAREATDVLLWQPSCGRKPSKVQPMTAMLCKKPPAVTSPLNSKASASNRGKVSAECSQLVLHIRAQKIIEHSACEDMSIADKLRGRRLVDLLAVSLDRERKKLSRV